MAGECTVVDIEEVELDFYSKLANAEAARSSVTGWRLLESENQIDIPLHYNDRVTLGAIEKIAKDLAKKSPKLVQGCGSRKDDTFVLTRFGKRLAMVCNLFTPDLVERQSHYHFNPWIGVMIKAFRRWHPGHRFDMSRSTIEREDVKRFTRIERFVRLASHSKSFKSKIQYDKQLAKKDFRSARDYLIWLFSRHSRLLILRVDLYYRGDARDEALSEDAHATFERFLRTVRRGKVVPDVLGCLSSREVGADRGVHFHVMVIMDGHRQWDADGHTRTIGGRWITDYAGHGRGAFFNCYARRHEYEYNGLGLVHLSDWRKIMGIRIAIEYMTKSHYLVKPKEGRRRNFRRGSIKPFNVKLGAPRKSGSDLSIVMRILGESEVLARSK